MRLFAAILLLATFISAPAYAQSPCNDGTVQSVSDGGAIIVTLSGDVFQVTDPSEQVDTALWLTSDDVLICDGGQLLVNTDENGETATVRRLR